MMHTEEEAKTKRCCGPSNAGELVYIDDDYAAFHNCIGSACMAWRPIMTCETVIGERDKKPEGDGWEWDTFSDDRWERPVPTGKGYCGLAGRPA